MSFRTPQPFYPPGEHQMWLALYYAFSDLPQQFQMWSGYRLSPFQEIFKSQVSPEWPFGAFKHTVFLSYPISGLKWLHLGDQKVAKGRSWRRILFQPANWNIHQNFMLIRQDLVDFPLVHGRKLANDMVCIKPVVNGGIVIQCLSSGPVFFSHQYFVQLPYSRGSSSCDVLQGSGSSEAVWKHVMIWMAIGSSEENPSFVHQE